MVLVWLSQHVHSFEVAGFVGVDVVSAAVAAVVGDAPKRAVQYHVSATTMTIAVLMAHQARHLHLNDFR